MFNNYALYLLRVIPFTSVMYLLNSSLIPNIEKLGMGMGLRQSYMTLYFTHVRTSKAILYSTLYCCIYMCIKLYIKSLISHLVPR